MANLKISQLSAAGTLDGTELVEVVKGGSNVQTTAQAIADLGGGGGGGNDKADALITVDGSHSGNYTLAAADLTAFNTGATIILEGDTSGDLTVPANATVAFPSGYSVGIRDFNNVVEAVGVTITGTSGTLEIADGMTATLEKTGTNTWILHNGTSGGGGGAGDFASITGDPSDNAALDAALDAKADSTTVNAALDAKVDEETFATLVDGTSVTWACDNRQSPLAKLTSTQSFTIDMTNVKSGSIGVLKLIKNTASDVILTFDTSFTNKTMNDTLTNYTFSGASGLEFFLTFIAEGTNLEWAITDPANPITTAIDYAAVSRSTTQSLTNNTVTAITWDAESLDTASIWTVSPNPTRLLIPGSGSKFVTITAFLNYNVNTTGVRRIRIYKNGGAISGANAQNWGGATTESWINSTFQLVVTGGDYLEVMGYQNSGAALDVNSANCTIKVEDL